MRSFLFIAAALLGSVAQAQAADTVIHAGTLIAVPGETPKTEQSILIEDGRIVGVEAGYVAPDGAKVIDLRSAHVLPGLMDMHVHVRGELGPRRKLDSIEMRKGLQAFRALSHARTTMEAGFTTLRDVGGDPEIIFSLRDAIEAGYVFGPRLITAGSVGITGGHGDISGFRPDLLEFMTSPTVCNGPYDCRRAVRQRVKDGADLIKIAATGGVLSEIAAGTGQQMQDDELREIVATAHSMGRKVAAHAHGKGGIEAALRAGVDSIEHGSFGDKATMKLYRETGAYLVPTAIAGATVVNMAKNTNFMAPEVRAKALAVGPQMIGMLSLAYKEGVKIAFGTDSGVSKHGINAEEFLLMKEAGMSEVDMLISATINTADLIGMSDTLGTIETGKHADIIAVDGDPLADISELLDVDFVMKGGRVAKGN